MEDFQALRKVTVEELLLPVLVQLAIVLLITRLFANLFRRFGQPFVVGEIFAGIILGPSLFGALFPEMFHLLFRPELPGVSPPLSNEVLKRVFSSMSQIGLIFLLFLVGLEFDFSHLRQKGAAALAISWTGVLLPFALGFGLAYAIHPAVGPHPEKGPVDPFGFALFMGVALSITAIPILGRIMMELNITRTRLGVIVISSAAFDDALGWILLATVATAVKSGLDLKLSLIMFGQTALFGAVMLFAVRPLAKRWLTWSLDRNGGELGLDTLALVLTLLFACAIVTNLIGIFAIFGAFLLGAVLSDHPAFRAAIAAKLRDLVTAFFLPIFFTYTGLRTEIGSLDSAELWLIALAVVAAALAGKFLGCGLAAYLSGFSPRESTIIGVMMNTRALMELIVVNAGYDLGVIPKSVFCMLVIMALVTTIMTTPILLRVSRGTELEPFIRDSGFLGRGPGVTPPAGGSV